MDIQVAAQALGGEVSGGGIIAPGPGHSSHDRSLRITFSQDAPDGFTVHSFANDDWQDCKDYVKSRLGVSADFRASDRVSHNYHQGSTSKTEYAQRIWDESVPYLDTPAWNYLMSRGLSPINTRALRYHPACPFKGETVPAMVAAMVDTRTNEFQGVHRTRLNPKDKAMLGPSRGAVVKLSSDDDVTIGLHICEGIETGISLLNMGFAPMWVCLSAGGIANFQVLPGIETLTIFADNDPNQTGQNAAVMCGQRWRDAGREVSVFAPKSSGADFAERGQK